MTDDKARLIAIYLKWTGELLRRLCLTSSIVPSWINDVAPQEHMTNDNQRRLLIRACDLWNILRHEYDKQSREHDKALAA